MRLPARLVLRPGRATPVPRDVLAAAGLPAREKVLASATTRGATWVLGTRRFLVLVGDLVDAGADHRAHRIPWERVEDATWDQDESRLRVCEIADFGARRPSYDLVMDEPALLLQLVRERVTASIVLQRRVPVRGKLGLNVIGRRSPDGGPVAWMHAYDTGLDPADPEVVAVAEAALRAVQAEVGEDFPRPI